MLVQNVSVNSDTMFFKNEIQLSQRNLHRAASSSPSVGPYGEVTQGICSNRAVASPYTNQIRMSDSAEWQTLEVAQVTLIFSEG